MIEPVTQWTLPWDTEEQLEKKTEEAREESVSEGKFEIFLLFCKWKHESPKVAFQKFCYFDENFE